MCADSALLLLRTFIPTYDLSCSLVLCYTIYHSKICRVSGPESHALLSWAFYPVPFTLYFVFWLLHFAISYFLLCICPTMQCAVITVHFALCAFVPRWVLSVVTTLEIQPPASPCHQQPLYFVSYPVFCILLHSVSCMLYFAWWCLFRHSATCHQQPLFYRTLVVPPFRTLLQITHSGEKLYKRPRHQQPLFYQRPNSGLGCI